MRSKFHKKTPAFAGVFLSVVPVKIAEQKRNAPQTGNTDKRIDDAGKGTGLSAEEKCDTVETEQAYTAPVQRADDHEDQRQFIDEFQSVTS